MWHSIKMNDCYLMQTARHDVVEARYELQIFGILHRASSLSPQHLLLGSFERSTIQLKIKIPAPRGRPASFFKSILNNHLKTKRNPCKQPSPVHTHLHRIPGTTGLIIICPVLGAFRNAEIRMHIE